MAERGLPGNERGEAFRGGDETGIQTRRRRALVLRSRSVSHRDRNQGPAGSCALRDLRSPAPGIARTGQALIAIRNLDLPSEPARVATADPLRHRAARAGNLADDASAPVSPSAPAPQ